MTRLLLLKTYGLLLVLCLGGCQESQLMAKQPDVKQPRGGPNSSVQCTLPSDCPPDQGCQDGICGPCAEDEQCAGTFACGESGRCLKTCTSDDHCKAGGFCKNGTCCLESCAGPCRFCDQAGKCHLVAEGSDPYEECPACEACNSQGSCAPLLAGTDPNDDCPFCHVCGLTGECEKVASGQDPLGECGECQVCHRGACVVVPPRQDPLGHCRYDETKPCGPTGEGCDGAGSCRYAKTGLPCGEKTCNENTISWPACDGQGKCEIDGGQEDCGSYLCVPGHPEPTCKTECRVSSTDCLKDYHCEDKQCLPPGKKALGKPCEGPEVCHSGYCVNEVCCQQEVCQECERCDESGKCVFAEGASCGAKSCRDSFFIEPICDSQQGKCVDKETRCANSLICELKHGRLGCLSHCQRHDQCVGDKYCGGTDFECHDPLPAGSRCFADEYCQSQFCSSHCCSTNQCHNDPCYECDETGGCQPAKIGKKCGPCAMCNGKGECLACTDYPCASCSQEVCLPAAKDKIPSCNNAKHCPYGTIMTHRRLPCSGGTCQRACAGVCSGTVGGGTRCSWNYETPKCDGKDYFGKAEEVFCGVDGACPDCNDR